MRAVSSRIVAAFLVWSSLGNLGYAQSEARSEPVEELSAETLVEAREHHQGALDALESGNLQAAERGFRSALGLAPRASSAFNLALVLIDRLQYVEAIVLLRGLERGRYGDAPVSSEELIAHRRLAERGVATLELVTSHPDPLELLVNGRESGSVSMGRDLRLRLDPGTYLVRGASVQLQELRVQLEAGEHAQRRLLLSQEVSAPRRGLIIGLTVAALVVVAAVTGLTVALLRRGDDSSGGLPVVQALGTAL
ncbi:MAG: hypothetical protein AB8H86_13515 [Polyangiales bacterium]